MKCVSVVMIPTLPSLSIMILETKTILETETEKNTLLDWTISF